MPGAKCNVDAIRAGLILKETPEITKAQDDAVAELFPHYLFYCRHTEGRHFTCSGCNRNWVEPSLVRLETPEWRQAMYGKHNEKAVCPRCGRKVILKQERQAKSRDRLWEQKRVLFLLAAPGGGLYGRAALATKNYKCSMRPKIELSEKERYYWKTPDAEYPKGTCLQAHRSGFWYRQLYREEGWDLKRTCCEPWPLTSGMGYYAVEKDYLVIGLDELEKSTLKYNGYHLLYGKPGETGNIQHGLCAWLGWYSTDMPQLEFVAKLGLRGVADELLDTGKKNARLLNWKQSRPDRFLRLRPEMAKAGLAAGLQGPEELAALQGMDKRGIRPEAAAELMRFAEKGVFEDIMEVSDLCGTSIPRLCGYIRKQAKHYKSIKTAGQCWADYIRECRALGYDLQQEPVVMPRDLAETHGTTSGLVKAQGNKALNRGYRETLLPKLRKKYEYDDGTYCILVPSGMDAIIGEGQRLKHCVGGYAERHVTGKTVILFLRESVHKTKSLCTIEIWDNREGITLHQIHGYMNEAVKGAVDPRTAYAGIMEPWLAWIKSGSPRAKDGTPKIKAEKPKQKEAVAV